MADCGQARAVRRARTALEVDALGVIAAPLERAEVALACWIEVR
jgi:hypothetical protein